MENDITQSELKELLDYNPKQVYLNGLLTDLKISIVEKYVTVETLLAIFK